MSKQVNQAPMLSPAEVERKLTESRQKLELCFKEFHKLLKDKVLDVNKSAGTKNVEKQVVDALYRSAIELDNVNVGEGVMSLTIITLRELLQYRDRVNELEFEVMTLKKALKDRQAG